MRVAPTAGSAPAAPAHGAAGARAAQRPVGLLERLAGQGLFLFRYRSLFTLILLPAAALAIYQRRLAGVGPEQGTGWLALSLAVCLSGLLVRVLTLGFVPGGTSGRDTREPRAQVLNTTGMYSVTRHPIYLGNSLMLLGYTMALQVWWFPLLAVLVYRLLFARIIAAEERYLARRFGAEYTRWSQRTPIFWPRPRLWTRPDLRFCWRSVLGREYNSFHIIATMMVFARFANQVLAGGMDPGGWARQDAWLLWSYGTVVVGFFVLRALRKHTRLLKPRGR
ncbi:MAG TPA: isoprenylcysteine carboxylmethyltransferase family protein [Thermoanaerobaculia bacterium]|nr:isoprenylcysteine carboxylmethyltransferase family protein [Thermoanaerobaculia bacterium]